MSFRLPMNGSIKHMRIKNKYIRNKHFRNKHWNKSYNQYTSDKVTKHSRWMESGHHSGEYPTAPSDYRRLLNQTRRSNEHQALKKINNGELDTEIPIFHNDASWNWF